MMIPSEDLAAALDAAEPKRSRDTKVPPASAIWRTLVDAPAISDEAIGAQLAEGGHKVSRQWIGSKRREMVNGLPGVFEMLAAEHGSLSAGLAVVDLRSTLEKVGSRRFAFGPSLRLDPGRADVRLDIVAAADGCYSVAELVREAGGAGVVMLHGALVAPAEVAELVFEGSRVVVIFGPGQAAMARGFAEAVAERAR